MIVDFYLTFFPISQLPFSLNLWLYSVLLKLVPCLVLTIFTACLVHAMYQVGTKKYKNNLFSTIRLLKMLPSYEGDGRGRMLRTTALRRPQSSSSSSLSSSSWLSSPW